MFASWKTTSAAALILACTAAAAPAQEARVHLAPFTAIGLEGGGHVTVQPAVRHEVRIVRGDLRQMEISVRDREGLRIRCRPNACRGAPPQIIIGTPSIRALAVTGGGTMRVGPGFGRQNRIAAAVNGGGQLDIRSLEAANVAAAVNGGGSILTGPAATNLAASVSGGGTITYWGNPRVASVVRGGGDIRRAPPAGN